MLLLATGITPWSQINLNLSPFYKLYIFILLPFPSSALSALWASLFTSASRYRHQLSSCHTFFTFKTHLFVSNSPLLRNSRSHLFSQLFSLLQKLSKKNNNNCRFTTFFFAHENYVPIRWAGKDCVENLVRSKTVFRSRSPLAKAHWLQAHPCAPWWVWQLLELSFSVKKEVYICFLFWP